MTSVALEEIYTAEWFANDFAELQPEFNLAADGIYREMNLTYNSIAVDVGCGPGMMIGRLMDLGCQVRGFEGSIHGIQYADERLREYILHEDITKLETLRNYHADVVICTEVAEHLDAVNARGLVALLASARCPIVFTAAPPGQDGHHHVNCQPQEYWVDLFLEHGVLLDIEQTVRLKRRWGTLKRLSHMFHNVMVFR